MIPTKFKAGDKVSAPYRLVKTNGPNERHDVLGDTLMSGTVLARHSGVLDTDAAGNEAIRDIAVISPRDQLGGYLVRFYDGLVVRAHEEEMEMVEAFHGPLVEVGAA